MRNLMDLADLKRIKDKCRAMAIPREVFDEGRVFLTQEGVKVMGERFSMALEFLFDGECVRRLAWPVDQNVCKRGERLVLSTGDGGYEVDPWPPSQPDLLADDWVMYHADHRKTEAQVIDYDAKMDEWWALFEAYASDPDLFTLKLTIGATDG